jgi:hypothetical protein
MTEHTEGWSAGRRFSAERNIALICGPYLSVTWKMSGFGIQDRGDTIAIRAGVEEAGGSGDSLFIW